jgi:hypothetical protein
MYRGFHWVLFLVVLLVMAGLVVYGAGFRHLMVYSLIDEDGQSVEIPDTVSEGKVILGATIGGAYRRPGVARLYADDLSLWENGVGIPCPT